MTQQLPTDRADRAARQHDINAIRTRTDGTHLRLAIVLALGSAWAGDDWIIVQVRGRTRIEEETTEGTLQSLAFEPGDITLARYDGSQVQVGSIRMGVNIIMDPGDVVHLHHGTCPCGQQISKPAETFAPERVPGLCELRAQVAQGKLSGDTEADPWAA